MRKIEVKKWVEKDNEGNESEVSMLVLLNTVVAGRKPEEIPKGIDKFRLYGRIAKVFNKADKTGVMELEESDYSFLKESLEKNVISTWALNPNINEAVEEFLNAKEIN